MTKVLRHGKVVEESSDIVAAVATAIAEAMFAPHELPLPADLWDKYKGTARAAIDAYHGFIAGERKRLEEQVERYQTIIRQEREYSGKLSAKLRIAEAAYARGLAEGRAIGITVIGG